jgi:hypothetical protein
MNIAKLWIVLVVLAMGVNADAQRAQFEVTSVKLHTSDDQKMFMVGQPNGRFVAANIPLRLLIRTAYQLQDDQVVGGPDWLATDRFDIDARAPQTTVNVYSVLGEMLQTLLADRFKLTTHTEKRELPVFALERSRRDGSFGPGLRSTACPDLAIDLAKPQPCLNIQTGIGYWLPDCARYAVQPVHTVSFAVCEQGHRRSHGTRWPLRHRSEMDARVCGPGPWVQ